MVKLNKIYTKTGDDGTTGLVSGPRRKKFDLRIDAYGSVDEANSAIGIVRTLTGSSPRIDSTLMRIQNDLFDLGSDLANPETKETLQKALRISHEQVTWLEKQIDYYNENLEPLNSFTLPGGTPLAAHFHLSRTIVRRAERLVAQLIDIEPFTSAFTMQYLNRLSDLLFVLARKTNENGKNDVLWIPGKYNE